MTDTLNTTILLPFVKIHLDNIYNSPDEFVQAIFVLLEEVYSFEKKMNRRPYCSENCVCTMKEELSFLYYITPKNEDSPDEPLTFIYDSDEINPAIVEQLIMIFYDLINHDTFTIHISYDDLSCIKRII